MILIRNINDGLHLQPIATNAKEIIVDISCGAAVLRGTHVLIYAFRADDFYHMNINIYTRVLLIFVGAHIFGPGVLAMQSNTKIDDIVNVYADLEGLCKKGTSTVYESDQKMFIGIGHVRMQRFQLYSSSSCSAGIAVEMIETISTVPSIGNIDNYLPDGLALLQNFPSIVCARVLAPEPDEIILDMCAAPGNKTTHIAQLMNDSGTLFALDKSKNRITTLKNCVEHFGIKCVQCFSFDATKAVSSTKHNQQGPPFLPCTFDRILLDAPCSGFGNRPILATKMTPKMLASYPTLQKKLLDAAAQLLKVGGVLVYSTCTIFPDENEMNVKWFLDKYGDQYELEEAEPVFGGYGLRNYGLNDDQCKKLQRFGPNFQQQSTDNLYTDSIGFFISKFRRKCLGSHKLT